ncbi:hypothetical protein [Rathayibacter sp. AY1C5]|uniref:hypothetical protein n=1 Tax=Rathayibacter sp. AY1C5 TaxID=2080538 RepID=UPI000CE7FF0B|nr:hypothetical protein [Rathayibacter sp. AY1C5]PPG57576.1 hypothetical protein C5C57_12090 [Rathayibacter sp. AY1C5]
MTSSLGTSARRPALDDGAQLATPRDAVRWLDEHCPTVARVIRAHAAQQARDLTEARPQAADLRVVIRGLDEWIAAHSRSEAAGSLNPAASFDSR